MSGAHRRQRAARFKRVLDAGARRDGAVREHGGGGARRRAVDALPAARDARRREAHARVSVRRAFDEYFAHAHEWLVTLAQIETVDAVENAQEIADVDGVDVVFVGPMDLTTSMGIPGQYGDARFHDALGEVADAAQSAGKAAGILLLDPANLPLVRELGYTVVALGSDGGIGCGGTESRASSHCAATESCARQWFTRRRGNAEQLLWSRTRTAHRSLHPQLQKKEDLGVAIQPASR
jgi:2-keto-3-deoxy-L-rhamnonate aldolase RhmA